MKSSKRAVRLLASADASSRAFLSFQLFLAFFSLSLVWLRCLLQASVPREQQRCFQLLSAKKSFVVEASSPHECGQWRKAIEEAQSRLRPAGVVFSLFFSSLFSSCFFFYSVVFLLLYFRRFFLSFSLATFLFFLSFSQAGVRGCSL